MGAVAIFNYAAWIARYPEFSTVTEPVADSYFAEASIYHDNSGAGPVCDANVQLALLNMMTAHVADLYSGVNGNAPSNLVGRITNASIGPISAGVDGFAGVTGSQQWLLQTKYGASYWYATAPYRTFRYRPGPQRRFDSGPPGSLM